MKGKILSATALFLLLSVQNESHSDIPFVILELLMMKYLNFLVDEDGAECNCEMFVEWCCKIFVAAVMMMMMDDIVTIAGMVGLGAMIVKYG